MFMFLQVCVPTVCETASGPALAWVPGPFEWAVIGAVALLVFGPKKLPQIGQAVGKSLREFKQAADGIKEEFNEAAKTTDKKPATDGEYRSPYESTNSESHPDHEVDPYYQQGDAGSTEDQSEQYASDEETSEEEKPAQYPQPEAMAEEQSEADTEAASSETDEPAATETEKVTAEQRKE